jgi:hypothetical protein
MLVQILDGSGEPHEVAWQGQDQINDWSGILEAGAVGAGAALQVVSPANPDRAGFLFQNTSANSMYFIELTGGLVTSAWIIISGGLFPPLPGYPIPTGALSVQGTAASQEGDTFTIRDWQNAANE